MHSIEQSIANQHKAQKIIRRRMLYAAGLGFIPIPFLDATAILSNQVLMIRQLSKLYEIPFKEHVVKSLIGTLVGNLGTIGLLKFIPGLGSVLGGATVSIGAVAATYALGKIFTQHFDQGGTLLDFDSVKSRQYFQQLHEEGELVAQALKEGKAIPVEVELKEEVSVTAPNPTAFPLTTPTFTEHFDQGDFDSVKSQQYSQQLHQEGEIVTEVLNEEKTIPVEVEPIKEEPIITPNSTVIPPPLTESINNATNTHPATKKQSIISNFLKWIFILVLLFVLVWVIGMFI